MITIDQAEKLKFGDKLIAYKYQVNQRGRDVQKEHRIGEATPVEFETAVILGVQTKKYNLETFDIERTDKPCFEVAFKDGSTQRLPGGRLFFTMSDAADAVREDIVDIGRMTNAIQESWIAYFKADADRQNEPPNADR